MDEDALDSAGMASTSRPSDTTTTASTAAAAQRRSSSLEDDAFGHPASTGASPGSYSEDHSTLRQGLFSLVGAYMGQQECDRRLACLAGQQVSTHTSWGAVVAAFVGPESSYVPNQLKPSYEAMRDAMIYTRNCHSEYKCDVPNQ